MLITVHIVYTVYTVYLCSVYIVYTVYTVYLCSVYIVLLTNAMTGAKLTQYECCRYIVRVDIVVIILAVYFLNVLKCEVLSINHNYSYWLTG